MDAEEKEILLEGSQFADLIAHPAWGRAKRYLNDIFIKNDSWSTLPKGLNQTQKIKEAEARIRAIEIVQEWVSEIEGIARQGKELNRALVDRTNASEVFKYFPETDEQKHE